MVPIIVLLVLLVGLYVGAFLSKRRFGLLTLGLAAGAIISPIWGETAGYVVSATGLIAEGPLVNAIAYSVLILIPAVLFMFHGYTYKHVVERVIGSLLFVLLAAAFLIGPVSAILTFSGPVGNAVQWFVNYHELIVSIGVALAVVDILFARAVHKTDKKSR